MCNDKVCAFCCPICFVCRKRGLGKDCMITTLLGCIGWLPAVLYACICVLKKDEEAAMAEGAGVEVTVEQQPITEQPTTSS